MKWVCPHSLVTGFLLFFSAILGVYTVGNSKSPSKRGRSAVKRSPEIEEGETGTPDKPRKRRGLWDYREGCGGLEMGEHFGFQNGGSG